jgi:hypothetical protein
MLAKKVHSTIPGLYQRSIEVRFDGVKLLTRIEQSQRLGEFEKRCDAPTQEVMAAVMLVCFVEQSYRRFCRREADVVMTSIRS